MELSLQFLEVDEDKLGYREHSTPSLPHLRAPLQPQQCPLGGPQAPGLHWQLGLKELWEAREVLRFALCFSFQPQPVPGIIISKGDKAPDGRKLAGAQGAGPSSLGASQQIVPWKQGSGPCGGGGLGGASLPQHTGPWRRPC